MDDENRIEELVRAFCGMFYIGTPNHRHMINKCTDIGHRLGLDLVIYNISRGLSRPDNQKNENKDPLEVLDLILRFDLRGFMPKRKLCILEYFDTILENQDPLVMTKLRLLHDKPSLARTVIILGQHNYRLPDIIADIPRFDLPVMSNEDIQCLIRNTRDEKSDGDLPQLASSLQGLTETECENVLAMSLIRNKGFDPVFIEKEKVKLLSGRFNGVIKISEPKFTLDDVGGLETLKSWLYVRGRLMNGVTMSRFPSLPAPKGILLTGPPGCGKSFISEAIAGSWKTKLVRLEPARCFNSLVGRTEQNLLNALEIIRTVLSPCVVIFDEFEKFFPGDTGNSSDGGVSSRALGIILDFLQSARDGVFVCATTNAVHTLSPEIMRSLRFDACWFIDLPQRDERKAIVNILMNKYGIMESFHLNDKLLDDSEYFSAAELEQAIIETMISCADKDVDMNEFMLLRAVNEIIPLAVSRSEELKALREWMPGRARQASFNKNNDHNERSRLLCPISQK
ncbi:MAG: AAA family ATPase [Deltaproteobacteria bacterium]|nr:AAA family ATPase [Deltaproteobacteria bacterium]